MAVDRSKIGLAEALDTARRESPEAYRRFLTELLEEERESKWQEAGENHRRWRRNMAIMRTRHIVNANERTPWPVENNAWSLIEGTRPIWGDNPPQVQIVPLRPGEDFVRKAQALRLSWEWAYQTGQFVEAWEELFDHLPVVGTVGLKVVWDSSRQAPHFSVVDPRAIFADPSARLHHRYARVLTMVHRVDIGEIRASVPEIADKIGEARDDDGSLIRSRALELRRDTAYSSAGTPRGARDIERKAEVVEMWFHENLLPLEQEVIEKAKAEDEASAAGTDFGALDIAPVDDGGDEDSFFVVTFIPEAGVVHEETVRTGRQVFTGQFWRNVDSIFGISDIEIIAGLQIAMDQLAIRGHSHRLAMFAPALINPKDTGVNRRHLSGRPAPILEPNDRTVAEGLRYLEVPGPNREAIEFFLSRPQIMRRLLGTDEIRPELFEREQTASGLALLVSALENRLRQKIRNMRPMVKDCVATTLRLMKEHMPHGFSVRTDDGQIASVSAGMLEDIDLRDYAIVTSLDRPGPLSKQARVSAIERAVAMGVFSDQAGLPLVVREMLLDELEVPRRDEIKVEFRRAQEVRMAQEAAVMALAQSVQGIQGGQVASEGQGTPGASPADLAGAIPPPQPPSAPTPR